MVLAVAVDVETCAVVGEQALLVFVQAFVLGVVENEGAFLAQATQFAVEAWISLTRCCACWWLRSGMAGPCGG